MRSSRTGINANRRLNQDISFNLYINYFLYILYMTLFRLQISLISSKNILSPLGSAYLNNILISTTYFGAASGVYIKKNSQKLVYI